MLEILIVILTAGLLVNFAWKHQKKINQIKQDKKEALLEERWLKQTIREKSQAYKTGEEWTPTPSYKAYQTDKAAKEIQKKKASNKVHSLIGSGTFPTEVVGESHYQENIASLYGVTVGSWEHRIQTAILIPDDSNKFDSNTIRIEIENKVVGHLNRDDAKKYCKKMTEEHGFIPKASCDAKVKGSGCTDSFTGEYIYFGIWLDFSI